MVDFALVHEFTQPSKADLKFIWSRLLLPIAKFRIFLSSKILDFLTVTSWVQNCNYQLQTNTTKLGRFAGKCKNKKGKHKVECLKKFHHKS